MKQKLPNKEEIKAMTNKIFNSIWFIILLGLIILAKTIFFYYHTIALTENLGIETVMGTVSFIVVIVCFLCVLPNRARIITGLSVDLFISILLFADQVYYTYSNTVLSVAQITNLQYGEEILSTLPMLLKANQIFFFFDFLIFGILLLTKIIKIEKKEKKTKLQLVLKGAIGVIGIIVFVMISIDYVEKSSDKTYNKDLQIREATIYGYHIYDIEHSLNYKKQTRYQDYETMEQDYEALKEEYQENYGEIKYDFQGIVSGENVLIVQLESVQEFVLHKEINGRQITPNLNQFLTENIEFTNMNMQSYSTTADSEYSTLTSLYPMENGMSFSQYYTNTYDDLYKIFNQANYYTAYVHGNDAYFWNRGNVYSKLGVKEIDLKEQLNDLEYINGFMSDEEVYRQSVEKMKDFEQPFFTFIVAASSHTPFELEGLQDRGKVSIDVGKYQGTYFGNYLEAVNYADYAFGVLLDELKKEGLYENTTILVFGDHNGLTMYDEDMLDFLQSIDPNFNDIEAKLNYTKVACGLKLPGVKHLKIEKPVSKLDIKPTLTYLCGLEDGFSLGTNMFASKEFVSINNERIISNRYYYDEVWYDIRTGEMITQENIDPEIWAILQRYYDEMKRELDISNSISINNLLEQRDK